MTDTSGAATSTSNTSSQTASDPLSSVSTSELAAELSARQASDLAAKKAAALAAFQPVSDVMAATNPTAITVTDLLTLLQTQLAMGGIYDPTTAYYAHANAAYGGLKQLQTLTQQAIAAISNTGPNPIPLVATN